MSHNLGRVVTDGTRVGTDAGRTEYLFEPEPAILDGSVPRFVILHFTEISLSGSDRIEVDLRYGTAWSFPAPPPP